MTRVGADFIDRLPAVNDHHDAFNTLKASHVFKFNPIRASLNMLALFPDTKQRKL